MRPSPEYAPDSVWTWLLPPQIPECSPDIPVPTYSTKISNANSVWGQEEEEGGGEFLEGICASLLPSQGARRGAAIRSWLELNFFLIIYVTCTYYKTRKYCRIR